jgi:hypothetical protein
VLCASSSEARPIYLQAAQTVGRVLCGRGIGLVYGGGNVSLMGKRVLERARMRHRSNPARFLTRASALTLRAAVASTISV